MTRDDPGHASFYIKVIAQLNPLPPVLYYGDISGKKTQLCSLLFELTRRSHVSGAGALYLLDVLELVLGEYLVEVGDDLVQETEALHALVVALQLDIELGEVGDGGEHHADGFALLVVQLLGEGGW